MQVVKRDGRLVSFREEKIVQAILKAFMDVDKQITVDTKKIAEGIAAFVMTQGEILSVETIQDLVEEKLMESDRKDVAKAYIIYRNDRSRIRNKKSKIIKNYLSRVEADNVQNANANVDEHSFSGREKEASADIGKIIALDFGGLSEEVANAHKEMLVYQHDLEKTIYGQHNCLNLNFNEIFKNGFKTRNGDVRPPASFSSGCQLIAVAFQCQSQIQYGGVGTIHLDYDLAPLVRMSFAKHYKDGLKWIVHADEKYINSVPKELSIEDEEAKSHKEVYEYALAMLEKEGAQAARLFTII